MPLPFEIDPAAIRRAVSKAIGSGTVELLDWHRRSIHSPFNQSTGGLYRVGGTGCDRGKVVPWSLVLKVVQASDDPFGGSIDQPSPTTGGAKR